MFNLRSLWRRERDLNPCMHSCITRFRIVRVRPLRHLCIVSIIYYPSKKSNSFYAVFKGFPALFKYVISKQELLYVAWRLRPLYLPEKEYF